MIVSTINRSSPGCRGLQVVWLAGGPRRVVIARYLCRHLAVAYTAAGRRNMPGHMRLRNLRVIPRVQFREELKKWQTGNCQK